MIILNKRIIISSSSCNKQIVINIICILKLIIKIICCYPCRILINLIKLHIILRLVLHSYLLRELILCYLLLLFSILTIINIILTLRNLRESLQRLGTLRKCWVCCCFSSSYWIVIWFIFKLTFFPFINRKCEHICMFLSKKKIYYLLFIIFINYKILYLNKFWN